MACHNNVMQHCISAQPLGERTMGQALGPHKIDSEVPNIYHGMEEVWLFMITIAPACTFVRGVQTTE